MTLAKRKYESWEYIAIDIAFTDSIELETIGIVKRGENVLVQDWIEEHVSAKKQRQIQCVFPYSVTLQ